MQTSRESSVWRSLAVAFGDGLAFGVGMKLTQQAARPASAPASSGIEPMGDRLAALEDRIQHLERAPAALVAPESSKLDRQILDALVQAVEARLAEQSAALDRRLADLEAKIALELKSVHEDLRALAAGAEARLQETESGVRRELEAVRADWSAAESRLSASEAGAAAAAEQAVDGRIASIAARMEQVGHAMAAARDSFRHEVATLQASLAGSVEKAVSEQSAAARSEVAALDRRTAELEAHTVTTVESTTAPLAAGQEALRQRCAALEQRAGAAESSLAATERRTADLETSVAATVESAVAPIADAQEAMRAGIGEMVEEAVEPRMEAVERRLLEQLQVAADDVAGIIVRETEATLTRRLGPLEAALAEKDRLVEGLKLRSEQSEAQVLDLLRSIGQVCREAVQRLETAAPPTASPDPPQAPPARPEAPAEPSSALAQAPPASAEEPPAARNGMAAEDSAHLPADLFAEAHKPGRVWRIPLVSSFLVAAASWAALYYL